MISYGIGLLLLICDLLTTYPHVTQPWYVEDAGAVETFDVFQEHMRNLLVREPP